MKSIIRYVNFYRDNDSSGNPMAIIRIEYKKQFYYRAYSYKSDYQAAENLLRQVINPKYTTYQNDVNPNFIIIRRHVYEYEKDKPGNTFKDLKAIFILEGEGSYHITKSEYKNLKEQVYKPKI